MKNYELVYVVKPNSDDETKESVLNKIKDVISSNGEVEKVEFDGEIIYTEPIGADDKIVDIVSEKVNKYL